MHVSLIVAAAGSGSRFLRGLTKKFSTRLVPPSKVFFQLDGRPLLERSLLPFRNIREVNEIWVAVAPGLESYTRRMLRKIGDDRIRVIAGGKSRAESVWEGIRRSKPKNQWVMVHDGARPLITETSIKKLLRESNGVDGVFLGRRVIPTVKQIDASRRVCTTLDRRYLVEAETPQMGRRQILLKAYERPGAFALTDEAALVGSVGGKVKAVFHDDWNPKITLFQDLLLAEFFLTRGRHGHTRMGFGRDTHRLVHGRPFYLGGIQIPFEKGPLGHSDGDALLHAISDAVLGGIARGDIGDWFSDEDPKNKGIKSSKILKTILQETKRLGWAVAYVDTVITLQKPRLRDKKIDIKKSLQRLMGLTEDQVSIKAKTPEGLGAEGKGLAVTCEAIVTLERLL